MPIRLKNVNFFWVLSFIGCFYVSKKSYCIERLYELKRVSEQQIVKSLQEEVDFMVSQWKLKLVKFIENIYEDGTGDYYMKIMKEMQDFKSFYLRRGYFVTREFFDAHLYDEYVRLMELHTELGFSLDKVRKDIFDGYYEYKLFKYKLINGISVEFNRENFLYAFSNSSQFKRILRSVFGLCSMSSEILRLRFVSFESITKDFLTILEDVLFTFARNGGSQSMYLAATLQASKSFYDLYKYSQQKVVKMTSNWDKLRSFEGEKWMKASKQMYSLFQINMLRTYMQSVKNVYSKMDDITSYDMRFRI